ncbi:MAG: hypothetical protein JWO68_3585 [Actinomycetia bacterium]|nr:hypothetical protein [Actinomycetes bacterium]
MAKRRLLRVIAVTALIGAVGTTVAAAAPGSGSVGAAQVATPFDNPNVFCTKVAAPPGTRNSSNPGVTPSSITFTDMSIDADALRRLGSDQMNFSEAEAAFFKAMNDCGGINGRKLVLKKALYNVAATDLSGHLQALCLKATEDQKAFLVTGVGPPLNQRCISVSHKSIYDGPVNMAERDFTDSKGRLISIYPSAEGVAKAFIADSVANGVYKGKKVGILGANLTATAAADQKAQYQDALEKKGVDVDAFEILPCTGNVCTQGIGGAISRMKQKGIDLLVFTPFVNVATIGSVWREMMTQNLKAQVQGPHTASAHDDSTLPALIRTAGNDGAEFAEKVGWYMTNTFEVHNGWRTGETKESAIGKMCTATLAKATGQRQYQFNETDISNARWGGTTMICMHVRQIFRALDSLGNNVTTERMVNALRNQKILDARDTGKLLDPNRWYLDRDTTPPAAMNAKFAFPCPLPTRQAGKGCFLPVDRPSRVRTIKY